MAKPMQYKDSEDESSVGIEVELLGNTQIIDQIPANYIINLKNFGLSLDSPYSFSE
ncbi:hypothetical protein [Paenibacillus sp. FSL H7-0714]|uniref:hypothetical protein n=1 Tax=Paenibacillus sp. FSL H7-0714 TaxID=2954735 RepID=UPI0030F83206